MGDATQLEEALLRDQVRLMERLGGRAVELRSRLEHAIYEGYRFPWRVAECPGLISPPVLASDVDAMDRLTRPYRSAEFQSRFADLVPETFRRPDRSGWFPRFLATDFQRSVDASTGEWVYGVPEIQSFPSNYLLKPLMVAEFLRDVDGFDEDSIVPQRGIPSLDAYHDCLREVVLGSCDPSEVAVVELDPPAQKTVVDLMLYTKHFGVRLVDLADLWVDEVTGEALYRRSHLWQQGRLAVVDHGRPQILRRAICRALPEEIDDAVAQGRLDARCLRSLFQGTIELQTCEWVVHPEDFFIIWKVALLGNPHHSHPLLPVDENLLDRIRELGLRPEDGVLKPASRAGGEGLVGFQGAVTETMLAGLIEQRSLHIGEWPQPAERARRLLLWQPKYPASTIHVPGSPGEKRFQEIRFMWLSEVLADGTVRLKLLAGMTRWAVLGQPANARFAQSPFTGTQGVAFPPGQDISI